MMVFKRKICPAVIFFLNFVSHKSWSGPDLDPDSPTAWIRIRVQQKYLDPDFSESGSETLPSILDFASSFVENSRTLELLGVSRDVPCFSGLGVEPVFERPGAPVRDDEGLNNTSSR
jgi:hypothetical protein